MTEIKRIVVELLAQIGSSREAKLYLQRYCQNSGKQFAVIKVGGGVLRDQMDELVAALGFLQCLGLYPIVIHGAGPQLDDAMQAAGIDHRRYQGMRVTTEEVIAVARPLMYRENTRLVDALEQRGIRARGISHGVFYCQYMDADKLGLVGDIQRVDLSAIRSAVTNGALPIVSCLGESRSGQVMNINADVATRELAKAIQPQKIIFITPTGGLLDSAGQLINMVSLSADFDHLMAQPWVHSGMRLKLQQIKAILDALPENASVSITSAKGLARELFTHNGCGTLIRRGEQIEEYRKLNDLQKKQLVSLLESAFDRRLNDEWMKQLDGKTFLLSESGRAAAVIENGVCGMPYLDKFVVSCDAQGEGLAATVWQRLRARYPQLYWRSRVANPITQWYYRKADMSRREGDWVAFTAGVKNYPDTFLALNDALGRESGWVEENA